jgi:hypothetical protein
MKIPGPMASHTIWFSTAGTGTSYGILLSARERWGRSFRAITADMAPRHLVAAAPLADEHVIVPAISDPSFGERLLDGLARTGADTYVPIFDAEISLVAALIAEGRWPAGVTALVPEPAAARLCLDKLEGAAWLAAQGLGTPATWAIAGAEWREGLVAKPRCGIGSAGFQPLGSRDELSRLRRERPDLIVQERLAPPEITVDAFRARGGGFFRAVCRERLEVKSGVCTKARLYTDEPLVELTRAVAERLPLVGSFCLQAMRHPATQDWMITDINARPGAGTRLSRAVGLDFQCATLADAWGEDARAMLPPLEGERWVVRAYTEIVTR